MLNVSVTLGIYIFQNSTFRTKSMLWVLLLYWKSQMNILPLLYTVNFH